jgi:hypothetical protein
LEAERERKEDRGKRQSLRLLEVGGGGRVVASNLRPQT